MDDDPIHFNVWYDEERIRNSRAILVGVYRKPSELDTANEHLEELSLLSETHHINVVESWPAMVRDFSPGTFLSSGKLAQLKTRIAEVNANLVIFDDEITAVQDRNLEEALRVPVVDRTEIILGVFADRAKTREAKLQIEMAQVQYLSPRLKRMWLHLSRQAGGGGGMAGGGYTRGMGEKQIEMDRRDLKRRYEQLQKELKGVVKSRETQRRRREKNQIPAFAIVGYTNAGKSTLLNTLTDADVLVEDMLFATLDTTTRQFILPNHQKVLLIDTVGFIRKLPHLLVAAFKSTLEEAVQADVLLHLIDSSHPKALEQAKTTFEVLEELNAEKRPVITLINKVDLATTPAERSTIQKLRFSYPGAIQISATTGEGKEELFAAMMNVLRDRRQRLQIKIPQEKYDVVAKIIREGEIFSKKYVENDVVVDVELPTVFAQQLVQYAYDDKQGT